MKCHCTGCRWYRYQYEGAPLQEERAVSEKEMLERYERDRRMRHIVVGTCIAVVVVHAVAWLVAG